LLRWKIPHGSLVLSGVAIKASSDEILNAIVPAFRDRCNVVQRSGKTRQLLLAIAA
jgi:hypothetical protein